MDRDKFEALDAMIYPILADSEKGAKQLEESCDECSIPIFFDKKKEVVKPLHQEVIISKLGRLPAIIVVDKEGIVRYAYFGESMADIPPNEEILEVLKQLEE